MSRVCYADKDAYAGESAYTRDSLGLSERGGGRQEQCVRLRSTPRSFLPAPFRDRGGGSVTKHTARNLMSITSSRAAAPKASGGPRRGAKRGKHDAQRARGLADAPWETDYDEKSICAATPGPPGLCPRHTRRSPFPGEMMGCRLVISEYLPSPTSSEAASPFRPSGGRHGLPADN